MKFKTLERIAAFQLQNHKVFKTCIVQLSKSSHRKLV